MLTNIGKGVIIPIDISTVWSFGSYQLQDSMEWEVVDMKELYVAPEAEIVRFVAEEKLAFNDQDSFLGFDVTDNQDGDWGGWDKWFN